MDFIVSIEKFRFLVVFTLTVLSPICAQCQSGYPYGDYVRLNMLLRAQRPAREGGDLITIKDVEERARFAGSDLYLFAYIPADPANGTRPLYRLRGAPKGIDRLIESVAMKERGFGDAHILGYPWKDILATTGLTNLVRKTAGEDNILAMDGEQLVGKTSPLGVAGYRRFGNINEFNLPLSAAGITIESNRVAGCAIWSWVHKEFQYINNRDYGREIQAAITLADSALKPNNPTEAGSAHSDPVRYPTPAFRQGSPCITLENKNTDSASPTQISRAVPLEWVPERLGGGANIPVIWKDMLLGKEVTLNFHNLGPVVKYTTIAVLPKSTDKAVIEVPAVYLNGQLSKFTVYDAVKDVMTPLTDAGSTPHGIFPKSGIGGIIVSDESHEHAFGLYAASLQQGGSVTAAGAGFQYMRWVAPGEKKYPSTSATTSKINALSRRPISAGENRYTTYMMTGTVTEVMAYMKKLYLIGAR